MSLEQIFTFLTKAVETGAAVALAASFVWGVLSILLSPCHLAGIPLIVGYIANQRNIDNKRAFHLSLLFAVGILMTIMLIGWLTTAIGRMAGDTGKIGNYIVAVVFVIAGISMTGLIRLPTGLFRQKEPSKNTSLLSAFGLGLLFGTALGPCTFAYMAPVLAVVFRSAAHAPQFALGMLLAYGLGHCSVIAIAGTSTGIVRKVLNWNDTSQALGRFKATCGVLVVAGGLYLAYAG